MNRFRIRTDTNVIRAAAEIERCNANASFDATTKFVHSLPISDAKYTNNGACVEREFVKVKNTHKMHAIRQPLVYLFPMLSPRVFRLARNWTPTMVNRALWFWFSLAYFRHRTLEVHRSRSIWETPDATSTINCKVRYRSVQCVVSNSSVACHVYYARKYCRANTQPSDFGSISPIKCRLDIGNCIFRCPSWSATPAKKAIRMRNEVNIL